MKFNSYTCYVSWGILAITALYTLIYSGLTGVLFTSAVGLLVAAFVDPFELVVASTVIFALVYTIVLKRWLARIEPFTGHEEIVQRIASLQNQGQGQTNANGRPAVRNSPQGVYSSSVEGFEDVQPDTPKEGAPSESSSASSAVIHQVDPKQVAEVTTATNEKEKEKENNNKVIEKEEFQSATNELFKLGKMPSEHKDGPVLDVGQTVMKAMSSLDPNIISSMTTDTKKLLDTQKGLMSMLSQMRPVLADGKELLQTFSGMFGGNGGPKM